MFYHIFGKGLSSLMLDQHMRSGHIFCVKPKIFFVRELLRQLIIGACIFAYPDSVAFEFKFMVGQRFFDLLVRGLF